MSAVFTPKKIAIGMFVAVSCVFAAIKLTRLDANSIEVSCQTSKGPVNIVIKPSWSPLGAERFLQLVDDGFFNNLPIFRCMDHFLCQFGSAPPRSGIKIYSAIADDVPKPELRDFKVGYLSFAGFGPNSRSTHVFITLAEVKSLGSQPWETPFGYVDQESMQGAVSRFEKSYGDSAPVGRGPDPQKIEAAEGAEYLKHNFPLLDSFLSCSRKN